VIAIDLPGFGSTPRSHRLDLDATAAGLALVMDLLEIERAHLVGHSMGGLIAGGFAAGQPERVDRLGLVDAAFLSLGWTVRQFLVGPATTLRWSAPSLLPVLLQDGVRARPIRLADAAIQLLRADWRSHLPRISAPTMVLWGEHDAICPPTIGQSIADMIPDARLVVIEGAAHDPMWEQPDRFDEEVVDFLGG
jgi:pimeloyl-ACP methyl ester carboxylesterase